MGPEGFFVVRRDRVHPEDTDPAEFGAVSGFLTITRSSSPGDIEDFYFILEQLRLAAQTGVSLGRNRLCRMSEERAAGPLTVEQLRGRMKKLERWGMILVGKTRQGSSITQTGEIFLKWLEATGQAGGRMGGR
ncbi:hypothetical protein [Bacilliculturomica massiliensis]|uniref:hypothetical protein n=1 Tax=Bacilliculturomica massiliensis TaxID=1917867 RepID=UPI0010308C18|nr:hypothetical protein [Bacilliculturomica massiliensis]